MRLETLTLDSDAFLVDAIWARARRMITERYPFVGAKVWPVLSLETRMVFFERAAQAMGVELR